MGGIALHHLDMAFPVITVVPGDGNMRSVWHFTELLRYSDQSGCTLPTNSVHI